jgi:hypothetical protein
VQNAQSWSAHELVETITDPDVGAATGFAPPLAWYGPATDDGEIGDICAGQEAAFMGFTVQKAWSNAAAVCIVTR